MQITPLQVAKKIIKETAENAFLKKLTEEMDKRYVASKDKSAYAQLDELIEVVQQKSPASYFEMIQNMKMQAKSKAEFEQNFASVQMYYNLVHQCMAFRQSPYVYTIDQDYQSEIKTISLDTPLSVFGRIPHLALFVDFPFPLVNDCVGALVCRSKTKDGKQGIMVSLLKTSLKQKDVSSDYTFAFPIVDVDITVGEYLKAMEDIAIRNDLNIIHRGVPTEDAAQLNRNFCLQMLSVILWLCVEKPDISDFTGKILTPNDLKKSHFGKDKKGKLIPPSQPILRIIGKQLGGEIRKFKQQIHEHEVATIQYPSRTVRPHIRSGHWHGYWYGSGDDKVYDVKWLNATLVNAKV